MSLRLGYDFAPTPNPIRASPSNENPRTVTLEVTVTPPSTGGVDLRGIAITIPVGHTGGAYLSPVSQLGPVTYDTSLQWKVVAAGSDLEITPAAGGTARLAGTVLFEVGPMPVDDTPDGGVVQLAIAERYADGTGATDATLYRLDKEPVGFVVSDFHADPSEVNRLEDTVTLHWGIDGATEPLGIRLSAPGWAPGSFDEHDGTKGVPSPGLSETTRFTLEAVSQAGGGVVATVHLRVAVNIPRFRHDAALDPWPLGATGRVLAGRWAAENTAVVSVEVDGAIVDGAAPPDTYTQPWPIVVTASAGDHTLGIRAWPPGEHPGKGDVYDEKTFEPLTVAAPRAFSAGAVAVSISPNSGHAYYFDEWGVTAVDLTTGAAAQVWLHEAEVYAAALALSADGSMAYALTQETGPMATLTPIHLPSGTADDPDYAGTQARRGALAITRDGAQGLVCADQLVLLDLVAHGLPYPVPGTDGALDCWIAPDETVFVALQPAGLAVIHRGDLETGAAARVLPALSVRSLAFSAKSATALVADAAAPALAVLDLASRAIVGTPIPLPSAPGMVAFAPGEDLAVVALPAAKQVVLVDLARGHVVAEPLFAGGVGPLAVAPDGSAVVVADWDHNTVVVL